MLTEITIETQVTLDHEEIPVAMLIVFGLMEKETEYVLGIKARRVKEIRSTLCAKVGGKKAGSTSYIAQQLGFKLEGTFKGEEIFTDAQKIKILEVAPWVKFAKPPKRPF